MAEPPRTSVFREHGSVSVSKDKRILRFEHAGPFNLEYYKMFGVRTSVMSDSMNSSGVYGLLIVYRHSMLHTQEAMDAVLERARSIESKRLGCISVAIVAGPEVEGVAFMRPFIQRYFEARGLKSGTGQMFDREDDARAWLEAQLRSAGAPGY